VAFTQTVDKSIRSVKYEYRQEETDPAGKTAPTWTIERPGSYAPGWEHMRWQTGPVKSVAISLFREGMSDDDVWTVRNVIVAIEADESRGESGSMITVIDHEAELPAWLADLIAVARFF
jgi:hypothetical protein